MTNATCQNHKPNHLSKNPIYELSKIWCFLQKFSRNSKCWVKRCLRRVWGIFNETEHDQGARWCWFLDQTAPDSHWPGRCQVLQQTILISGLCNRNVLAWESPIGQVKQVLGCNSYSYSVTQVYLYQPLPVGNIKDDSDCDDSYGYIGYIWVWWWWWSRLTNGLYKGASSNWGHQSQLSLDQQTVCCSLLPLASLYNY